MAEKIVGDLGAGHIITVCARIEGHEHETQDGEKGTRLRSRRARSARYSPIGPSLLFRDHPRPGGRSLGGQVADDLLVATVADQAIRAAGSTSAGRVRYFGVGVIVVVSFLDPLHREVGRFRMFAGISSVSS